MMLRDERWKLKVDGESEVEKETRGIFRANLKQQS